MRWPWGKHITTCEDSGELLLSRYHLCFTHRFGVYVHKLWQSDDDRALHDHPWTFFTFLFHRGYWEHTVEGRKWRPRWSVLFRPAEYQHRLEVDQPTWTFVIRFRRRRLWGFWVPTSGRHTRFLNWDSYTREFCD